MRRKDTGAQQAALIPGRDACPRPGPSRPGRKRAPWCLHAAADALSRELRATCLPPGRAHPDAPHVRDLRRALAQALATVSRIRDASQADAPFAELSTAADAARADISLVRARFEAALAPTNRQTASLCGHRKQHPTASDGHALRCELPLQIADTLAAVEGQLAVLATTLAADHADEDVHRRRCERAVLPLLRNAGLSYGEIARLLDAAGYIASRARSGDRIRKAVARVRRSTLKTA